MENENTLSAKLTRIDTAVDRIRVKTDTAGDAIEDVATAVEALKDPTGNINITNTNSVNVSDYATAQIVDANLIAENIKKDITVLGITGTHESGIIPTGKITITENDTNIDVSTYATADVIVPAPKPNIYKVGSTAERDAIANPEEDDMCIIYKYVFNEFNGVYPDLGNMQNTWYFPATITLNTAITSSNSATMQASSNNITITLNATTCTIKYRKSVLSNVTIASYTSSDGLVYTRTSSDESE